MVVGISNQAPTRPPAPQPGSTALVYGFGVSGRAAAALLRAQEVVVVAIDDRATGAAADTSLEAQPGVDLRTAEDSQLPQELDLVVVSPGVPASRPLLAEARRRGVPVISEVELAYRYLECPLLAITGSNGKSTTTAWTVALLRAGGLESEACGNFGKPLSACVEGGAQRVLVVELSSFQLELCTSMRPRAAALLNVAADHLDRHGTLEEYAAAKRRVFAWQQPGDVAVLNAEDPIAAGSLLGEGVRRRLFSSRRAVTDGCFLAGTTVLEAEPGRQSVPLFELSDVPLEGEHNLENAMAAALLARALEVPRASLQAGLRAFTGLAHRCQHVARVGGVLYVDDSKGTNVAATLRSLEAFPDRSVHAILGGRAKGARFDDLVPVLQRKAVAAYLIGEAAEELKRALGSQVETVRSATLQVALRDAARRAMPGEVVLLSPACASFDQFRDFADRGETFARLVAELEQPEARRG